MKHRQPMQPFVKDDQGVGVYRWRNLIDGKVYIGGAYVSFKQRETDHRNDLRKEKHWNKHLQRTWLKHGEANFVFEILEICEPVREIILACEQKWIDHVNPTDDAIGYNKCPTAGSMLGYKLTPEHKEKLRNRIVSEETKRRLSKSQKGKKLSEAHKAKCSKSLRGRKLSPEHKARIASALLGKKRPAEVMEKVASAKRGKKRSAESRERMSLAQKARYQNPEARQALSRALKGKKKSDEHKRKLSLSNKLTWRRNHELSYVSDDHALEASSKAREQWPETGGCRDAGCEWHVGVKREDDVQT